MDELNGLDPNQKHSVRTLLRDGRRESHRHFDASSRVEAVCTRAVIIDRGQTAAGARRLSPCAPRYHNAVVITVPETQRAAVMAELKAQANLASVEAEKRSDGLFEITAFPRKNALLIEDVSAFAVRQKWDVRELHADAGRLDEVFRAITTSDAARTRASAA